MKLKKVLIIAVVVLAVAIAAVLGFTMKPAEKATHDYFLINQGSKTLVMDALNPDEVVAELELVLKDEIAYCSKDSSTIIFKTIVDDGISVQCPLVHYDIASDEKTIIDENVYVFVADSSFKTFLYVKENDTKLYKKALTDTEPEIIAENVVDFYMSDNGQTIVYNIENNGTFLINGDSEAVFLGENVSIRHFEKTTGDFVYFNDSKLIVHKDGKDTVVTEKLYISDGAGHIGSCDRFYFYENQETIDAESLIVDDLKETLEISDADIAEFKNSLEEYTDECDTTFALRKAFYYDNGKISEVCDNIIETVNSTARSPADKVAAIFCRLDPKAKIKLSDLYGVENEMDFNIRYHDEIIPSISSYCIAKKDQLATTEFENQTVVGCVYDYTNSEMYLFTHNNLDDAYLTSIYKTSLNIGSDELILIEENKEISATTAAVVTDGLFYEYYDGEINKFCHNGEVLVSDTEYFRDMDADNTYYISAFEGDTKKVLLYFDGEFHEYPDIDLENNYIYSTANGNFIIYNLDGEYYCIISDGILRKFDIKYDCLSIASYDLLDFGTNYFTMEY